MKIALFGGKTALLFWFFFSGVLFFVVSLIVSHGYRGEKTPIHLIRVGLFCVCAEPGVETHTSSRKKQR